MAASCSTLRQLMELADACSQAGPAAHHVRSRVCHGVDCGLAIGECSSSCHWSVFAGCLAPFWLYAAGGGRGKSLLASSGSICSGHVPLKIDHESVQEARHDPPICRHHRQHLHQ